MSSESNQLNQKTIPKLKASIEVGHVVKFHIKVFQNKNYVPYYDEYKGHQFEVVAFHYEREDCTSCDGTGTISGVGCTDCLGTGVDYMSAQAFQDIEDAHVELRCLTGDVKVKGHVHYDEIQHVPVESCDMNAFDVVKYIGAIPMSIETKEGEPPRQPTDAEIRRWLDQSAVIINGKRPKAKDTVEFPITELIFFPKSAKKRTTVI
jgi:hypothetical protein